VRTPPRSEREVLSHGRARWQRHRVEVPAAVVNALGSGRRPEVVITARITARTAQGRARPLLESDDAARWLVDGDPAAHLDGCLEAACGLAGRGTGIRGRARSAVKPSARSACRDRKALAACPPC
jgi:hypothetical protein